MAAADKGDIHYTCQWGTEERWGRYGMTSMSLYSDFRSSRLLIIYLKSLNVLVYMPKKNDIANILLLHKAHPPKQACAAWPSPTPTSKLKTGLSR